MHNLNLAHAFSYLLLRLQMHNSQRDDDHLLYQTMSNLLDHYEAFRPGWRSWNTSVQHLGAQKDRDPYKLQKCPYHSQWTYYINAQRAFVWFGFAASLIMMDELDCMVMERKYLSTQLTIKNPQGKWYLHAGMSWNRSTVRLDSYQLITFCPTFRRVLILNLWHHELSECRLQKVW